jgi:hypothetical protein
MHCCRARQAPPQAAVRAGGRGVLTCLGWAALAVLVAPALLALQREPPPPPLAGAALFRLPDGRRLAYHVRGRPDTARHAAFWLHGIISSRCASRLSCLPYAATCMVSLLRCTAGRRGCRSPAPCWRPPAGGREQTGAARARLTLRTTTAFHLLQLATSAPAPEPHCPAAPLPLLPRSRPGAAAQHWRTKPACAWQRIPCKTLPSAGTERCPSEQAGQTQATRWLRPPLATGASRWSG